HPVVRYYFVFFFQAEDGIRDFHVTGVQTCALPIFSDLKASPPSSSLENSATTFFRPTSERRQILSSGVSNQLSVTTPFLIVFHRSEERRVGKECRSRCWPSALYIKHDRRV